MCKTHYNKATGNYIGDLAKDSALERARLRLKTHRRKDWARLTDITPEFELGLRRKAKTCPLCSMALIDEPYLPTSKELDHIVPRGAGGTHTIGNVRIICRTCNRSRPHDGSDFEGQLPLWAQAPIVSTRPLRGYCKCGTRKVQGRCFACRPRRAPRPPVTAPSPRPCLGCGVTLTPTGRRGRPRKRCEPCVGVA